LNLGLFVVCKTLSEGKKMRDVQSQPDFRKIALDRVGIKRLSYPITVLDRQNGSQETVGEFEMMVDLPHMFRGTHMSRFLEILDAHRGEITIYTLGPILRKMKRILSAEKAEVSVKFPFFIEKTAPVSKAKSLLGYECRFFASFDGENDDFVLSASVPVTTLCPCSKAISRHSAHNQRSIVTVSVRFSDFFWLEDLIRIVEESASAEIFSLLKRSDEKFLTERAYANPRFAEDIVREIALRLNRHPSITWYAIETENFESIHGHSAYAFLKREKSEMRKAVSVPKISRKNRNSRIVCKKPSKNCRPKNGECSIRC